MLRRCTTILLTLLTLVIFALTSSAWGQRRNPGISRGSVQVPSTLTIRVIFPNNQSADTNLLVQLQSSRGGVVASSSTDSSGQVTFSGLLPGTYQVQISGAAIEPTMSGFEIQPNEGVHNETVQVKLASTAKVQGLGSPQPTISATELNVPEKARKELQKGNEAVKQHDVEKARKHYEKAIESYPKYTTAYNNLATVCMAQQDYGCAREGFEKAIASDSGFPRAYVGLARLRMIEQNYGEADTLLHKSLSLDPANVEALALLANTELLENKYQDALEHARKAHSIEPHKFAVTHLIAAHALEAESHPQDAIAEYKLFLAEAPPNDPNAANAREALQRLNAAK